MWIKGNAKAAARKLCRAAIETLEERRLLASVSGYVYNDLDGDGNRGTTEPGIEGVTVQWNEGITGDSATLTTDSQGRYQFDNLIPGYCHSISVQPNSPWYTTTPASSAVWFASEGSYDGPSFGLTGMGSASGTVMMDLDGSGNFSAPDASFGGISVFADVNANGSYDSADVLTTTNSDGSFSLTNIPSSNSCNLISIVPPEGWAPTWSGSGTLSVDRNASGLSFSLSPSVMGSVSGVVRDGQGSGLGGQSLTITAGSYSVSTTSDETGAYSFAGLTPRTYSISVAVPEGWQSTGSNPLTASVTSSIPNSSGVDFYLAAPAQQSTDITGVVYQDRNADSLRGGDDSGIAGIAVIAYADPYNSGQWIEAGQGVTDADGFYRISGLTAGQTYRVESSVQGHRATAGAGGIWLMNLPEIGASGIDQGWTRGIVTVTVSSQGTWVGARSGVPVDLLNGYGEVINSGVSDNDGLVRFYDLDAYQLYSVIARPGAGYRASTSASYLGSFNSSDLLLDGSVTVTDAPGSVSGTVWEDIDGDGTGDIGSEGWQIYCDENNNSQLDGDEPTALTDSTGAFALDNIILPTTWSCAIIRIVPRPGWESTADMMRYGPYSMGSPVVSGVDFNVTALPLSVDVVVDGMPEESVDSAANETSPGVFLVVNDDDDDGNDVRDDLQVGAVAGEDNLYPVELNRSAHTAGWELTLELDGPADAVRIWSSPSRDILLLGAGGSTTATWSAATAPSVVWLEPLVSVAGVDLVLAARPASQPSAQPTTDRATTRPTKHDLFARLVQDESDTPNHAAGELSEQREANPGAFLPVNNDDDDYSTNGSAPYGSDLTQKGPNNVPLPVVGENDLLPVVIRGNAAGGVYSLSAHANLRWYEAPDRSVALAVTNQSFPVPIADKTLYLEASAIGIRQVSLLWTAPDGRGRAVPVDTIKISPFQWEGALNVPQFGTYNYTVTGIGTLGKWLDPVNGTRPAGQMATARNVDVRWNAGPKIGRVRFQPSDDYVWGLETNVVEIVVGSPKDGDGNAINPFMPGVTADGGVPNVVDVVSGNPGFAWKAYVSANGPNQHRGVAQIEIGFIQNVKIDKLYAVYKGPANEDQRRRVPANAKLGQLYLDVVAGAQRPWYNSAAQSKFVPIRPTTPEQLSNRKEISASDTPTIMPPNVWKSTVAQSQIERLELLYSFDLYVAARTLESRNGSSERYPAQAQARWNWDASANVNAALVWDGGVGNRVTTPATGWGMPDRDEPTVLKGDVANMLLREDNDWTAISVKRES